MSTLIETDIRFKILKSIIEEKHIIVSYAQVKLYTASKDTRKWLFSNIQGLLFLVVDYNKKKAKFLIYSTSSLSLDFEFEFYPGFAENYTIYNPLLQYFELGLGFIGFSFSSTKQSEEFYKNVKLINEVNMKKIIQTTPIPKEFEIEENYCTVIKALKTKLEEEYLFKTSVIGEDTLVFNHKKVAELAKVISYDSGNIKITGSKVDLKNICGLVFDASFSDPATLKVRDSRKYASYICRNIENSLKDLEKIPYNPKAEVIRPSFKEVKEVKVEAKSMVNTIQANSNTTTNIPNVPKIPNIPNPPVVNKVSNVPNVPKVPVITSNKGPNIPSIPIIVGGKGPKVPAMPDLNKINAAIAAAKEISATTVVEEAKPMSQEDKLAEIQKQMNSLKKAEEIKEVQVVQPKKLNLQDELKMKLMKRSQLLEDKDVSAFKEPTSEVNEKCELPKPTIQINQDNSSKLNFREQLLNRMGGKQPATDTKPIQPIQIELPEGTKSSDRMDINKMIEAANKEKEKQAKSQQPAAPLKVVENKGGNVPKVPLLNLPGKKK